MEKVYKVANKIDRTVGTLLNRSIAGIIFLLVFFISRSMIRSSDFSLFSIETLFAFSVFGLFLWAAVTLWRKNGSLSDYLDVDEFPQTSGTAKNRQKANS